MFTSFCRQEDDCIGDDYADDDWESSYGSSEGRKKLLA